jgi:glycine cleavage system H protein
VGISSFAADELTDITFVEMKPIGTTITTGGSIGEVESVKATSDVFSVIGGQISAVNETVTEDPALVNTDSYGEGWLVKLKSTDLAPLDDLMDWTTYSAKHPVG